MVKIKLIFLVLLFGVCAQAMSTTHSLLLENCHLDGIRSQVKCGTLEVPENYLAPKGKHIAINVAVLPAIDKTKKKTPLFFLAGGPGQAAVELAAYIKQNFSDVLKTRDIILVDQRGTGLSQPMLCDESDKGDIYSILPEEQSAQETVQCLEKLKKFNNLRYYTTENAIRDFDAVRHALHYKQVNLYGGSYGTRAALVYMRLFPHSIKSVVLDSVAPIELPIGLFGQSSSRSFDLLLENCEQDAPCSKAFPNLRAEFNHVVERLSKQNVSLSITHPRLGTKTPFTLSRAKFVNIIFKQLYGAGTRSLLPLAIHQAYKENYQPLVGLLSNSDNAMSIYVGLTFNIVCSEDLPKITPELLKNDSHNKFSQDDGYTTFKAACNVWPKYKVNESFYQPTDANIPTLILSGNLDPVTPPSNGELSAKALPNSYHVISKNSAHIVASSMCGIAMINNFLETLVAKSVDQSCLGDMPNTTFMTSVNGSL